MKLGLDSWRVGTTIMSANVATYMHSYEFTVIHRKTASQELLKLKSGTLVYATPLSLTAILIDV